MSGAAYVRVLKIEVPTRIPVTKLNETYAINSVKTNQTFRLTEVAFPLSHTFTTRNIYVFLLFLSAPAHSLMSSYGSLWRKERNVRTVNAQEAPN